MEPKHVKNFYESLVKEAKSIYKKNNIQIVLDKHMDYVEQESGVTCGAERQIESVNENLPIHDSVTSAENNNNISFPTADISYSTINYIRTLEETNEYLLYLLHLLRN